MDVTSKQRLSKPREQCGAQTMEIRMWLREIGNEAKTTLYRGTKLTVGKA